MVIRKGRMGEPEVDLSPVRGAAAISLTTRLSIESFSLTGSAVAEYSRQHIPIRFVTRSDS